MSEINEKLSVLERKPVEPIRPQRSRIYLLFPAVILFFIALFVWQNRSLFQQVAEVNVEPTIAMRSSATSIQLPENSVVFQAAGWVEADPYATKISPFVSGIVDKVLVIDGQVVKKNEILAVINDEELKLDVEALENVVSQHKIRVNLAKTTKKKVLAKITQLEKRVVTLKAETARAKNYYDSYLKNRETLSELAVDQARLSFEKALASQNEVENEVFELNEETKIASQKIELSKAELVESELKLQRLSLDLSRCVIKSPVDGVVMDLKTAPGQSAVVGQELMAVFDPQSLQVRVDVLFADAPAMHINQKAEIKLDALPNRMLKGVVTSIVGQADIQRNTVQAKVKIVNPDPLLRPEMLARVQFLASTTPKTFDSENVSEGISTVVPVESLINRSGNKAKLWVVSRSSLTVESRDVSLGATHENSWIEAFGGVKPGEWVVVRPSADLENGQKVKVVKK